MDINSFLKDLILSNRRVIIPNLGAFLHIEENSDAPKVAFSAFLRYNDEVLEKAVMQKFKISSLEASKVVNKLTEDINTAVETYGRYYIEELGYFVNENSNLNFILDPDAVSNSNTNFIIDKPTKNEKIQIKKEVKIIPLKKKLNSKSDIQEKVFDKKTIMLISVLSLVAVLVFAFIFLKNISSPSQQNKDDILLNTILSEKPKEKGNEETELEKSGTDENNTEPITKIDSVQLSKSTIKSTNTPDNIPGYHIIAGCFMEKLNAERFVDECLEKGYKNSKIINQIGDLYPVSILKFNNVNEAKEYINTSDFNEDLWVYRSF